jgi:hypothetical protein
LARPPRSSIPSLSGEPRLRRLGVGASTSSERPLRAQLVVAGVVCVILIAVPLYLLRRPSNAPATSPSGSASVGGPHLTPAPIAVDAGVVPPSKPTERVRLAAPQRVKCGASATQARVEGGLCDSLPSIEQGLVTAIKASVDCAPKRKEEGTINYVVSVDFAQRRFHVFPGACGSWRGPQARRATDCANRAFPNPDWGAIAHQYRYYWVAVLATYPLAGSVVVPSGTPTFE